MSVFLNNLKISGDILARTIKKSRNVIRAGVKTKDIDKIIETYLHINNASPVFKGYNNYKYASCISVNNILVHGIPSDYVVAEGDVVSIDIGVKYKDAITDGAITVAVGKVSEYISKAISETQKALTEGIMQVKVGGEVSHISKAIEKVAINANLGVVKELSGHGTGVKLHMPPTIYNYFNKNSKEIIKESMVLAIEPMFSACEVGKPNPSIKIMKDKWSVELAENNVGIHFEHTVMASGERPLILTKLIDTDRPLW